MLCVDWMHGWFQVYYRQHFPDIAVGYEDPRVTLHLGDGPEAEELADDCFMESVARALRPGGVMSCPADSLWHKEFSLADFVARCGKTFEGSVSYAWCTWDDGFHALLRRGATSRFQKSNKSIESGALRCS
ncbi:hypothetical protein Peur_032186 [Populus x canadensis]